MSDQEQRRVKIDIPSLEQEKKAFSDKIIGQNEAIEGFALLLAKLKSGIKPQRPGPTDIKFLAGPSGVGKTEMVYRLAEILADGEDNPRSKVIKINCGEYTSRYMVARILGAPPGYRGSEDPQHPDYKDPALLTQPNLDNHRIFYKDRFGQEQNVVIILVDEAEKAHEDLHRTFLSVLDKGQIVTGLNKTSNLSNALIFYTSNVGNQEVERLKENNPEVSSDTIKEAMLSGFKEAFLPEFRGRIKDLIVFEHLDVQAITAIAGQKIHRIEEDFSKSGIRTTLDLSPDALTWIINRGYSTSEGVRALEKVIEHSIQDRLMLVGDSIHRRAIYVEREDDDLSFFINGDIELPEIPSEPAKNPNSDSTIPDKTRDISVSPALAPEVKPVVDIRTRQEQVYRQLMAIFGRNPYSRAIKAEQIGQYTQALLSESGVLSDTEITARFENIKEFMYRLGGQQDPIRRFVLSWQPFNRSDIAVVAFEVETPSPPEGPKLGNMSIFSGREPYLAAVPLYTGNFVKNLCLATTGRIESPSSGWGQSEQYRKKAETILKQINELPPESKFGILEELTNLFQ